MNPNKPAVLFIGSFLSKSKGTTGIAEKMRPLLSDDYVLFYASSHTNKILRMADIFYHALLKSYSTIHCDVFSGQSFYVAEFVRKIARLRAKKVIMNLQGGRFIEFLDESESRRKIFNHWATSGAHLITPSNYLSSEIDKKWNIAVEVHPNFIDIEKFPFSNRERTGKKLLWVRAFSDLYQPELAVQALALLEKKYTDITLTMVGPDKGNLDETLTLIKKLGIEGKIQITGPIPNEKLYEYFHSHDIYLNTTAYESFGLAVFEAASSGIPIISTKVGELPYIWKDRENIIFTLEQSGLAFADAIESLLLDHDLSNQIQKSARLKSEQYVWKAINAGWRKLLNII